MRSDRDAPALRGTLGERHQTHVGMDQERLVALPHQLSGAAPSSLSGTRTIAFRKRRDRSPPYIGLLIIPKP